MKASVGTPRESVETGPGTPSVSPVGPEAVVGEGRVPKEATSVISELHCLNLE